MPSPFSLLSESPARRRARRAQKAGQQPPTPVSESPYGTPRDTDVKNTDGSDTLQFPASFADVATSPAVSPAASPDGRAQARRRLQDKSRHHWAGVSSPSAEQVPPQAPPNHLLAGLSSIFGAAESTTTALQRTLAAGPSEAMVLQALRELPMHRALNTWRNGIEERRERARRFKLASADGVRQWIRQWRLAPSLILWQANIKADQQRDVVLLRMRKITVRVEQRVELERHALLYPRRAPAHEEDHGEGRAARGAPAPQGACTGRRRAARPRAPWPREHGTQAACFAQGASKVE